MKTNEKTIQLLEKILEGRKKVHWWDKTHLPDGTYLVRVNTKEYFITVFLTEDSAFLCTEDRVSSEGYTLPLEWKEVDVEDALIACL